MRMKVFLSVMIASVLVTMGGAALAEGYVGYRPPLQDGNIGMVALVTVSRLGLACSSNGWATDTDRENAYAVDLWYTVIDTNELAVGIGGRYLNDTVYEWRPHVGWEIVESTTSSRPLVTASMTNEFGRMRVTTLVSYDGQEARCSVMAGYRVSGNLHIGIGYETMPSVGQGFYIGLMGLFE